MPTAEDFDIVMSEKFIDSSVWHRIGTSDWFVEAYKDIPFDRSPQV